MSQITEKISNLVRDSNKQDQLAELREARKTLEERVRGNEDLLLEVRNGRASAEKRENDLKAGNDKVMAEIAKLREMALTTKKGSGPMEEFQSLLIKWTSTNSLLATSLQRLEHKDQKLQSQEEQIRSLSDQLGQAKADQEKSLEGIQELSQRLGEGVNNGNREKEQLVCAFLQRIDSED